MPIQLKEIPSILEGLTKFTSVSIEEAMVEAIYPRITFDGGTTSKAVERMMDYEPMGSLPYWPEATAMDELFIQEGWSQKLAQTAFGGAVVMTKQVRKFDQTIKMENYAKMLGAAAVLTREIIFNSYYHYGHVAAASIPKVGGVPIITPTCGDGQPFFSASHAWRSNPNRTLSNLIETYVEPTRTGIATMYELLASWTDPHGRPLNVTLDEVMVPKDLIDVFLTHWKSPKQAENGTNAVSTMRDYLKNGGFENRYLTNATDWYGLTSYKAGRPRIRHGWKDETDQFMDDGKTKESGITLDFSMAHAVFIALGAIKVRSA